MKDTDEPAFPLVVDFGQRIEWYKGMTLRDYFAAKAMQAMIARIPMSGGETARDAYIIADAMLEARDQ